DKEIDGYYVYMSEDTEKNYRRMMAGPITDTEWVSPPLRPDRRYFFYITAVDRSDNESRPSATVLFSNESTVDKNLILVDPPITKEIGVATKDTTALPSKDFRIAFQLGGY
ncbi:hypothetical protein, partial [Klebsiella pneumoniae]|uniref:hypothetical protein n=1 Tax=Klebsiella pneumoniae TaxID=573 RepID=UPI003B9813B1